MSRLLLLVAVGCLMGCSPTITPTPLATSCKLVGFSALPASFSFAPGPVNAQDAEQRAAALFETCEGSDVTVSGMTVTSAAAAGMQGGPNEGQSVWLVHVDATISEPSPGATYDAHFLIEVNQATGTPAIVGQG